MRPAALAARPHLLQTAAPSGQHPRWPCKDAAAAAPALLPRLGAEAALLLRCAAQHPQSRACALHAPLSRGRSAQSDPLLPAHADRCNCCSKPLCAERLAP